MPVFVLRESGLLDPSPETTDRTRIAGALPAPWYEPRRRRDRQRPAGVNAEARVVNLVLLAEDEVGDDGTVSLTGARAQHIVQVLGSGAGDQVRVGVLDGKSGVGTVIAMDRATVQLHCAFDTAAAPPPRVDILLAVPRPKVMRRLWAQLAALGVGRIILTNAARVERNYFDTHILTEASYRPLLIEGLQQARDTRLPLVTIRRQFKILVEDELDGLCGGSVRVAAHPGAANSVFDAVRGTLTLVCCWRSVLKAAGPVSSSICCVRTGFTSPVRGAHSAQRHGVRCHARPRA